ncbi:hypothetical protein WR25_26091 [Diploscapter pachys]|uniref:G domain-containing protein n=1 Tax=Diploscapter pachys TaxID=2018661 RepID=A0A2A2J6A4_9BILA|nr:hypothetical protein WR25_26091 [Diploscapter pachys]
MITRQALGRIAQLGDLYDAHTDCFCVRSLFNSHLPENTIRLTNTPKTACEYVIQDSISEKLKKLEVEAELKASILSGTIEVNRHGKYLSTNDSTAKETSTTLISKMLTKHEAIKIDNKEVVSLLSPDVVRNTPNATHVVVEIQWGAVAIATLKCKNEENKNKTDVETALKAELACLEIGAKGRGSISNSSTSKLHGFQFEFHADVVPDGDHLPQDVDQGREFMGKLPAHVANANGGKGVPIRYTLMPLSEIKTHLGNIESSDRIVNSIDEDTINKIVRIFDKMNESMHPKHGIDFVSFNEQYLKERVSKFCSYKEINILILGETGVGKSTWINGFANYLTFQTLKEAEKAAKKGKLIYLVPSKFTITDSNYNPKMIEVGEAENESFQVGESCTQEPRSYVFNIGERMIRLIDTPGIGDCRGLDQDALNFSSILRYIAQIPKIHGICILLKPNNSRLNIIFKYCINELLTHLHVSAAENIAFCFTNARSTFYRPGDTLPALKRFLKDLKSNTGVEIAVNEGTIYCMDNESFRFLCCSHKGEKFTKEECKNFEQSWTQSVKETKRLLKHFEMDVKPHTVGKTVSLNEARTLILTLAKPLTDITQNIQDNIAAINAEEEKIKELDLHSIDLQKNLMIPQISFKIKQLDHPRTVCTGIDCIDTETLPDLGVTKTIYKTICHDPCHCCPGNVISETVPNPALQKCNSLNNRVEKYREGQKTINEICAKFGAFLKEHSILPYNDAIEDYLKFDIGKLKRQSNRTGSSEILQKVERLEEQLRQYKETKSLLDQNMQSGAMKKVEAAEIKKMQEQLEQLELTGKETKKLFDATVYGQQTNFCYKEIHFDYSQYRRHRSFFQEP